MVRGVQCERLRAHETHSGTRPKQAARQIGPCTADRRFGMVVIMVELLCVITFLAQERQFTWARMEAWQNVTLRIVSKYRHCGGPPARLSGRLAASLPGNELC